MTYDIQWLDTGNDRTNFGRDYIFQKFIPSASTISGIQLYFTGTNAVINLCKGTLDTGALLNNHACANGTLVASTTCTTNASPHWYSDFSDCPFSSSHTLVSGADYYYEIIGVWTRASGVYDYTYPGQICGVQSDGSSPTCSSGYPNGYMVRNNLRTYSTPPPPEPQLEPVIIVPGVMGSYLYSSIDPGVEVWPAVGKTVIDPWDLHLNQLIMDEQGIPSNNSMIVPPQDIIRSVLDKDFFTGLIEELKQNGYEEGENLFVFPYDWRLDLNWTAASIPYSGFNSLKDKIEQVKQQTGAQKVNIIAHSMGGLVAKNYIKHYGSGSVDKFINIGTPHLGAPEALKILMYGDDLGFNYLGIGLNSARAISERREELQGVGGVGQRITGTAFAGVAEDQSIYYYLSGGRFGHS